MSAEDIQRRCVWQARARRLTAAVQPLRTLLACAAPAPSLQRHPTSWLLPLTMCMRLQHPPAGKRDPGAARRVQPAAARKSGAGGAGEGEPRKDQAQQPGGCCRGAGGSGIQRRRSGAGAQRRRWVAAAGRRMLGCACSLLHLFVPPPQLPYLVANIVEVLDVDPEEEEEEDGGCWGDGGTGGHAVGCSSTQESTPSRTRPAACLLPLSPLLARLPTPAATPGFPAGAGAYQDAGKKGKCIVLKTSTRQVGGCQGAAGVCGGNHARGRLCS